MYFDAVVAGGSIAGLLCAREIAAGGHSVAVIEEGSEIGTPEHCGGLVSRAALEELGVAAGQGARGGGGGGGAAIESARITAPDGRSFTVGARKQGVVGIDRRELDKRVAFQAQEKGAAIMVGTSLRDWDAAGGRISTNRGAIGCRIMVDATGASSLARRDRTGILPSAQYEVYADWIADGRVEVAIDSRRYPGFFAWVIPSGGGRGRVGVAGRGINAARALEAFLEERDGWGAGRARAGDGGGGGRGDGGGGGGRHSTIRKIFAPIWVNGPIRDFVDGRRVVVGDAAGQAKPTTGGGIFTSGMGGVLAGQAISGFLGTGDPADLREYQRRWTDRFGREFERQLLARRILERMDNDAICGLFGSITPEVTREISENDDFDFHTGSIMRVLGIRGAARAAGAVAGSELRRLAGRGAAGRTP